MDTAGYSALSSDDVCRMFDQYSYKVSFIIYYLLFIFILDYCFYIRFIDYY
ncbi:hypothetical protein M0802_016316 [Mischocyttarus mexicanus]|nr:hypothetical protein M0802_016316 [Mischocyttarus mexicanus]